MYYISRRKKGIRKCLIIKMIHNYIITAVTRFLNNIKTRSKFLQLAWKKERKKFK